MLDKDGNRISWWPERYPLEELEEYRLMDEYVFAGQYLNNPVDVGDELVDFPIRYLRWISPEELAKVHVIHYTTTVDTAETVGKGSDHSVITTCAWSASGKCYVVEIKRGKFRPDELVEQVIAAYVRWRPLAVSIEEMGFVRGLKSAFGRARDIVGMDVPFNYIKRDTQLGKEERIRNTLQPWYKAGDLIFLSTLDCREQLIDELTGFPKNNDDILDTLADQFQGREWYGRLVKRTKATKQEVDTMMKRAFDRWIGNTPYDETGSGKEVTYADPRIGVL